MSTARGTRIDRSVCAALLAALLAVAPAACTQAEVEEAEHYQASKVAPAKDGGHPVVTITKLGAERIDLEMEAVRKKPNADPLELVAAPTEPQRPVKGRTVIPYAAVLYDGTDGQPYVYVNTEGLSFQRVDVSIENIEGDSVELSEGPPPGARVVTAGVPQIHGAELDYGAY